MKILWTFFRVALHTTINIIIYLFTQGHFIWLEGRVLGGRFHNWGWRYGYQPQELVKPGTEAELVDTVKNARRVRVFGSGHSFNAGIQSQEVLLSLDNFSGVTGKDVANRQMTVKGGTRVRDVIKALNAEGLAFVAQPSHDAQSIGGILSTDVHGTGKNWGHVSESIVKLRILDGRGQIHECGPQDDLFKAAVGGVGAVGIIIEAVVEGVPRFKVEQRVEVVDLDYAEENIDALLDANDHLSFYLFPFSTKCQMNRWNVSCADKSFLGTWREAVVNSLDTLVAVWIGNLLSYSRLLPYVATAMHSVRKGTNLVMESHHAFNRTIYPLHQELEFAVPYADAFPVSRRFLRLHEEMYDQGLPYSLLELRFTPAGHERTLLGAGQGRHSAWIDVLPMDSEGYKPFYEAAEALVMELGGRPHLGKYSEKVDKDYLAQLYGQNFERFQELMAEYDPEGKFANDFTRRLFGDPVSGQ
jgi:hypothetical protein